MLNITPSNAEYQPLVSVVIPVYNNENTIIETLSSIFCQDYKNIEVIIVDDGSTDKTPYILEQYKGAAKIIHQSNAGSAVARSQGIINSKGKYIAFIDADDLWVPWKISAQVKFLERHQDTGMVYNAWIEIQGPSEGLPFTVPSQIDQLQEIEEEGSGWLYTKLLMECIIHTSSVLISKEVCDDVGPFDTGLRRGQDYDYWLKVSQRTKIAKLKSVLSAYRIHANSITKKPPDKNYEAILLTNAIEKFGYGDNKGNKISKDVIAKRLANSWESFCWQAKQAAQYRKCFYSAINIIKYRPFGYLGWWYLLTSLAKVMVAQQTD